METQTPQKLKSVDESQSLEQLEKDSKRNTIIVGSVLVLAGILFIAATMKARTYSECVAGRIMGLIFISGGIYYFCKKKIEKYRRELLKDENSWLYRIRQSGIEKKQRSLKSKAVHHGSMKQEATIKFRVITGTFAAVFTLFTVVMTAAGAIVPAFIIIDLLSILCFGLSFLGRGHKKLLRQYSEFGLDENMAENDFSECSLYKKYAGISRRFITIFPNSVVIPIEKVVWVYPKVSYIYHYLNCVYTHIQEKYSVIIYDENGKYYELECPEAMCKLIIDDIIANGKTVSPGFSKELAELYFTAPASFSNAAKNFPMPSPYQMPPNEIK